MSHSSFKTKEFKALAKEWNKKLEASGHVEIEEYGKSLDTPFLIDYHSVKFQKKRVINYKMQTQLNYYLIAGQVLNTYAFKNAYHRKIWELHADGMSVRAIAKETGKDKTTVWELIRDIKKETIRNGT